MAQAKPKAPTSQPCLLKISGLSGSDAIFVCRDLAAANKIAQAFIDADALPTDLCTSMDVSTYTIPFLEKESRLEINIEMGNKIPIDLTQKYMTGTEYKEQKEAAERAKQEVMETLGNMPSKAMPAPDASDYEPCNYEMMVCFPPDAPDSHHAE